MKRIYQFKRLSLVVPILCSLFGCGNTDDASPKDGLELVEDKSVASSIYEKPVFEYTSSNPVPGENIFPGYAGLWGKPTHACLIGAQAPKDSYYFLYLPEKNIPDYKNAIKEFEDSKKGARYAFSSYENEEAIDGKYLYAARKAGNTDYLVYHGSSLSIAPLSLNGYQLVYCCQSRTRQYLFDASLGVDPKFSYEEATRVPLEYRDGEYLGEFTSFLDEAEKEAVASLKQSFASTETYLTPVSSDYASSVSSSISYYGGSTYGAYVKNNEIRLPRYAYGKDLLSDRDLVGMPDNYDLYGSLKEDFLAAYLRDDDSEYGQNLAWFDYDAVCSIIASTYQMLYGK